MTWSQIWNNLVVAGFAAVVLIGVAERMQLLWSRSGPEAVDRSIVGSRQAFIVLQVATGLVVLAIWAFALIRIGKEPQPLIDGRLLQEHAAQVLIPPLMTTSVWLLAMSRPVMLALTFFAGLLLAFGTAPL
jgi:hypothetical protein